MIPELRRSAGEGIGYTLQYSWVSLVVQLVKDPPAVQETWVQSLGWEDPMEEGMATNSSIPAWRMPMDRGAWQATIHWVTKSQRQLSNFHFFFSLLFSAICKASSDNHFAFLFLGDGLDHFLLYNVMKPPSIVLQALYQI